MRSNTPMSLAEIRNYAPAVFADSRDEVRTSDRYVHVPTQDILTAMLDNGYGVSRAQQKNTRKGQDMATTRHLLSFRPLDQFAAQSVGDTIPEVVLVNSHDGTCSYKLMIGMYRLVCSNGMIVGKTFEAIQVIHRGDAIQQVLDGTKRIWEYLPTLNDTVQSWRTIELSPRIATQYAEQAMKIRHGDDTPYEAGRLLEAHRAEDEGNDLWVVYNRVQENLMKGGIEGRTATGRRSVSRAINRVTKDVIYNRELWDLTNEFAKAA